MWRKEKLDEELTYEQFLKELEDLKGWISKSPRRRRSWLYSVEAWARGDH
jgi:hypothetical protein